MPDKIKLLKNATTSHLGLTRLGLIASLILLAGLSLSPEVRGQNNPTDEINAGPTQAVLDEINSIREQLGGGVASELQGLWDQPEKNARSNQQLQGDFDAELQRLSQAKLSSSLDSGRLEADAAADSSRPHVVGAPDGSDGGDLRHQKVNAFRTAARNLERAAAALEEAGCFQQADEIREKARGCWVQARLQ